MARKTRKNTEREITRELWVSRDFMSPYTWFLSNYEPKWENRELIYDTDDYFTALKKGHFVVGLSAKSVSRWLGEEFAEGTPTNVKIKIESKIKLKCYDENDNIIINSLDGGCELLNTKENGKPNTSRNKEGGEA